ncbi:MAG TPA: hypothetical protein VGI81_19565 [Tepidisphaeraceae bacterium]
MDGLPRLRLVVVFNHKYDNNLDKLDAIYRDRFPDTRYLVPFYQGSRSDVIPVHESSAQFQGYFAHATHAYIDPAVSHYAFIADDLLLNPDIHAGNLLERFGVGAGEACIENLNPLNNNSFEWPHTIGALFAWPPERFVMYRQELPTAEAAAARFAKHGVTFADITWRNLRGNNGWKRYPGWHHALKLMVQRKGRIPLPDPMAMTYADIVIVPRESIRQFAHLCGVFAAMRLWVEIAIPTALALSCDRIVQLLHGSQPRRQIWTQAEVDDLERRTDRRVSRAFDVVGRDHLYIHPVKLSRWTV